MKKIFFQDIIGDAIPKQLSTSFNASAKDEFGEFFVEFKNEIGKGTIRKITFDWGVTLINFEAIFKEETHLIASFKDESPVDFIFITEGGSKFVNDIGENIELKRFQNIIITYKIDAINSQIFKPNTKIKKTIIQIIPSKYKKKKNYSTLLLPEGLTSIFNSKEHDTVYNHFGNFSLKIADQIRLLQNCTHEGLIRNVMMEGYVHIIMGLQLHEYEKFEHTSSKNNSLSSREIDKIDKATLLIGKKLDQHISVETIAQEVMLTPTKLQEGFRLLHAYTVNGYSREVKLQKAREYLEQTDMTISEIVYSIGYRSRSYFSKIFTERFHMLPTAYRKNNKVKVR